MRKQLAVATLALSLLWAGGASAAQILFNPDGTGNAGALSITALDPLPGNAIGIGVNATSPVGTVFELKYQANLGTTTLEGATNYVNGENGQFFTFAVGFSETIIANNAGNLVIGFDATEPNFFRMYANDVGIGSDLAGTGFTAGDQILFGHVLAEDFSSGFNNAIGSPTQALDQAGAQNDYPGVNTIVGSGATSIRVMIDSFDANYFPDLVVGTSILLANTSQVLPFAQTNPSALFSSDGIADGDIQGVSSVGLINALGDNTMFQADANIAIEIAQVPAPLSVALLGLGLVAMMGVSALRRKV